MKKTGKCILVCAGDLEISDIPVKEDDLVIAVDGGYLYCGIFGIEPDVVIGDFDSLEEKYRAEMEEVYSADKEAGAKKRLLRLNKEKNDGLEDIYWELAGSGDPGETSQLLLIGMMIDRAEIKIEETRVEVKLYKKFQEGY